MKKKTKKKEKKKDEKKSDDLLFNTSFNHDADTDIDMLFFHLNSLHLKYFKLFKSKVSSTTL